MTADNQGRTNVLAVVVTAGNTPYLSRTLRALAGQSRSPDTVLIVDVSSQKNSTGDGRPLEQVAHEAELEIDSQVRVVRAQNADNFGQAINTGLAEYENLVKRAREKASLRAHGEWIGITGELSPITTGELLAVAPGGEATEQDLLPQWLWLLHDDSAPAPEALRELLRASLQSTQIAAVGPKQRAWSKPARLLEVGIEATRTARRLNRIEENEIDQGQFDTRRDVLALGSAGLMVKSAQWRQLGGFDSRLGPYGDGLEFGRRLRLAGWILEVAPRAIVHHARASYRGLRGKPLGHSADIRRSFYPRRTAQTYNALLASAPGVVALAALGYFLLGLARGTRRLVGKEPALALAEIRAGFAALTMLGAVVARRRKLRKIAVMGQAKLAGLEATGADIRWVRRQEAKAQREIQRNNHRMSEIELGERRQMRVRSVALALTLALVAVGASILLFGDLWGVSPLRGGAYASYDGDSGGLWRMLNSSWVLAGDGYPGAFDGLTVALAPYLWLTALLGVPAGGAMAALLYLAPPAAALSAWLGAGAITRSLFARGCAALIWSLAPVLYMSVASGRQGAVLAHVLLPLFGLALARTTGRFAKDYIAPASVPAAQSEGSENSSHSEGELGRRARRERQEAAEVAQPVRTGPSRPSASAAGAASLLLVAIAGASPLLLVTLGLPVLILALAVRGARIKLLAVYVPATLLNLPLLAHALSDPGAGTWRTLLTDPGLPLGHEAPPGWMLALGLPQAPGMGMVAGGAQVAAIAVLWGFAVLALLIGGKGVWKIRLGWFIAVSGLAAATVSNLVDTSLTLEHSAVATGWPGSAISLMLAGILMAALAGEGPLVKKMRERSFSSLHAAAFAGALALALAPVAATLVATGGKYASAPRVEKSTGEPILALGLEQQRSPQAARTLNLTLHDGVYSASLWRGPGVQLGSTGPVIQNRAYLAALNAKSQGASEGEHGEDEATAHLGEALARALGGADTEAVAALAQHAVSIVRVPASGGAMSDIEREELAGALDSAPGLTRITSNESGIYWRVSKEPGTAGSVPSFARAALYDAEGRWLSDLDSKAQRVSALIPAGPEGRRVILAERYDPNWSARVGAVELKPVREQWRQAFEVPAAGGELEITYGGAPWDLYRAACAVIILIAAVAALPVAKTRREVQ